jgi:two-component sensor histidine kinase
MADDFRVSVVEHARTFWRNGFPPNSISAFVFSVGCVMFATLIRVAMGYVAFESGAFGPYYAVTLIITLLCGWRAALAGATAGGVCGFALFVLPEVGPLGTKATAIVSLCLYGATSIVIIWVAESYRKLLARVRAQEQYTKLLSGEMAHRIKNILTLAQTVVWHSLPDNPVVRDEVSSRLAALARTNERLLRARGPISFSTLLNSELEHFGTSKVTRSGPDFSCGESASVFLSLVFHELATNAAKYGALAAPNGKLTIEWRIAADGQLCIDWREEGVSNLRTPDRRGFGSKLLRSVSAQFNGHVNQLFGPDGVKCAIWLELAKLERTAVADVGRPVAPDHIKRDTDQTTRREFANTPLLSTPRSLPE